MPQRSAVLAGTCISAVVYWEGHRILQPRKDRVRLTSLRFGEQRLGEAVGESGNCSFSLMERGQESADNRGDEGGVQLSIGDACSQADQNHPRKQTEPGVCSTAASIATVQKRDRRERRSHWSGCIELMDGRGWTDVALPNVLRSFPTGNIFASNELNLARTALECAFASAE
jgi:hypothetical protein